MAADSDFSEIPLFSLDTKKKPHSRPQVTTPPSSYKRPPRPEVTTSSSDFSEIPLFSLDAKKKPSRPEVTTPPSSYKKPSRPQVVTPPKPSGTTSQGPRRAVPPRKYKPLPLPPRRPSAAVPKPSATHFYPIPSSHPSTNDFSSSSSSSSSSSPPSSSLLPPPRYSRFS